MWIYWGLRTWEKVREMLILAITGIDLNIEYSITKGLKQISYVRSPSRAERLCALGGKLQSIINKEVLDC